MIYGRVFFQCGYLLMRPCVLARVHACQPTCLQHFCIMKHLKYNEDQHEYSHLREREIACGNKIVRNVGRCRVIQTVHTVREDGV